MTDLAKKKINYLEVKIQSWSINILFESINIVMTVTSYSMSLFQSLAEK